MLFLKTLWGYSAFSLLNLQIGKGNVLRKGKLIIKPIINKNQDELNNFRNPKMILNSPAKLQSLSEYLGAMNK